MVAAYEEEREHWLATHNSIRVVRVREVLTARTPIDVDEASEAIRYPLRWHHLALVMWCPSEVDADELGSLAKPGRRQLGAATNASGAPLFIPTDRTSGWAWLPYRSAPADAVESVRRLLSQRTDAPSVAIGTPAAGLEGFRQSHQWALAASTVAAARGDRTPAVLSASEPGLTAAALLGNNIEHARRWVNEVLGGLAADTANEARLRETLRIFLGYGCSYKAAAQELSVHSEHREVPHPLRGNQPRPANRRRPARRRIGSAAVSLVRAGRSGTKLVSGRQKTAESLPSATSIRRDAISTVRRGDAECP